MTAQIERREFLRVEDIVQISYSRSLVQPPQQKQAQRKDISGGGIRIISKEELPVGTILDIKMELPDIFQPTIIKCKGRVVWCQKMEGDVEEYNVGIAYVNIPEQDRKKIINYVFGKHRMQKLIEKHKKMN